ncbi:putative lipoprotein, partial [Streptomyces ipomoeae 91-03]
LHACVRTKGLSAEPVEAADADQPHAAGGESGHLGASLLGFVEGLQEEGGGHQHLVDVETGEHQQVVLAPPLRLGVLGQFGGHLLGEPHQLLPDGVPHGLDAAVPLAGDEADVCGVRVHVAGDQLDGALDEFVVVADRRHQVLDHRVQTAQRLLDERDAEVRGRAEVPVEGGRGDAHGPGDLAQPEAAQALLLQQTERGVQECLPGLLLLGLPGAESVTHAMQLTTVLRDCKAERRARLWGQ